MYNVPQIKTIQRLFTLLLIVCLWSISQNLLAQNNKIQDVLVLKNGDRINGHILEKTETDLKIRLYDGSEIIYQLQDIETITQEHLNKLNSFKGQQKGYFNITTIGLNLGIIKKFNGLNLQSINGYRFNPYVAVGLGAGINEYNYAIVDQIWGGYYPRKALFYTAFFNLNGEVLKETKMTPTYAIDYGYRFLFLDSKEKTTYINYSLGLKVRNAHKVGFIFSVNYQIIKDNNPDFLNNSYYFPAKELFNNKITLRTGVSF